MIFKDILLKQEPIVKAAVEELFNAAKKNQAHPQDILLVIEHGYYDPLMQLTCIGPDEIGFSMVTQYKFYHWYRENHIVSKKEIESNKVSTDLEELSVHIEKLVYLKFWESDMILKRLYQLVNSAKGQPYDWTLKIPEYDRQGKKHEFIRKKIRDRAKDVCPKFYVLLKDTYLSQLRNAIAHSKFYIVGRRVSYLNHSGNPEAHCPIPSLTFDEWAIYFHNTILLYNEMIKNFKKMKSCYVEKTAKKGFVEVQISKDKTTPEMVKLRLRNDHKAWEWLQTKTTFGMD